MHSNALAKKEDWELAKAEREAILVNNTKPALFRDVKNVSMALASNHNSLATLKKNHGERIPLAVIKIWIVNLNDFLNISRKMNPLQIDETAEMILNEFYYLKTSDIALVFSRIKTGFYGQFYESIDGMKILDIFYKYAEERMNYCIDSNERQHHEIKQQS